MFNLHHACHPARQFNQCEFNICTIGAGKVRRRQDNWRWLIVLHRPLDPLNPTSLVCFGARARGTWGTAKLPEEILLHPMVCSDSFQSSTMLMFAVHFSCALQHFCKLKRGFRPVGSPTIVRKYLTPLKVPLIQAGHLNPIDLTCELQARLVFVKFFSVILGEQNNRHNQGQLDTEYNQ